MANSTTIKEFLVKLGFISDEAALNKFKTGISQATKAVVELGASIVGLAASAFVGIERFSNNLEALYFAARRTGDSATNLAAFSMAARNFGVSSEEALGAAESLATFLRTTYGASVLGISNTDAQGKALTDTQLLINLGKHWATMSTQLGSQYAAMIGVSQPLFLALRNGEFAAQVERTKAALGPGFESATKSAHQFMDSLRWLGIVLEGFGAKVIAVLDKKLGWSLDRISLWFQKNGTWLANKVVEIVGKIIDVCNEFLDWVNVHSPQIKKHLDETFDGLMKAYHILKPALTWLWQKFQDLDEATGGWSTTVVVLVAALAKLGLIDITAAVIRLTASFVSLGASAVGLAPLAAALVTIATALTAIYTGYRVGEWAEDQFDLSGRLHDLMHPNELPWHDWSKDDAPGWATGLPTRPLGSRSIPEDFGSSNPGSNSWGGSSVNAKTDIHINAGNATEAFNKAFSEWHEATQNALRGLITPII